MRASTTLTAFAAALLTSTSFAQSICLSEEYELVPQMNRPATRNCETKGHLNAADLISTGNFTDMDACVTACKRAQAVRPQCKSFGYSAGNGTCELYGKRLIDMQYRNRQQDEGTVYSNMLCYKCKPVICDPDANLIKNGYFAESGDPNDPDSEMAKYWTVVPGSGNFKAGALRDCDESGNCVESFRNPADTGDLVRMNITIEQQLQCLKPNSGYAMSFQVAFTADGNADQPGQEPLVNFNILLDGQRVSQSTNSVRAASTNFFLRTSETQTMARLGINVVTDSYNPKVNINAVALRAQ